ncbi:MAG: FMN-binding glutamate synthase family protein [Pseudomonadales bacterium]|nr:FMN-binding glutamate synthase family protein [Pseudomonadales bacterium]MBO6597249.1 FMN-binding glutamate synthase family protein [Pseudomonadales bacterium]MBO6655245.1 FMN-binding glutamate synthase family protein [Pseudomonadales bacterium]MBO6703878.1 FMN-binding glutamate synthase family protein [Pseudomonadales bacterium]MBO6823565.1 FMN-binding glutamate synthase family protein [Pseudomonadales bacterium]
MEPLTSSWVFSVIEVAALLFIVLAGVCLLAIVAMYVIDVSQTHQTIRRNYPVIGRFRYLFEHLGEFFRQYFFAMDREELPFNRADRSWAYRAAKDENNTIAFGSTRDLRPIGSVLFVNCPYPTLDQDAAETQVVQIGPYCEQSYAASSLINISGMSYGALSVPAIRALSAGAAMSGCWMNTGEGGLSPYHLEGGADIVFQIGTAKFGVRDMDGNLSDDKLRDIANHPQVKMFEIKLSQGAKPGKGGILPGAKVTKEIAKIRGIEVGQDAISPNRHVDINNSDELLDMIDRVRRVTGKPVGFKSVIGAYGWLDDLFARINERGIESAPDFITIDSADGGTGAAPMPLMDSVGLPISESLPMVVDKLCAHGLRERVKVVCSGKLITPSGVAWAMAVGADFVTSARGFMFALGCIQALQCNKNTCPTGITTHDKKLQRGLVPEDKAYRVANFVKNMNYEVGVLAHSCGVPEPRGLKRFHARVVTENGRSIPLDEMYPPVTAEPIRVADQTPG